jgi:transposase
METLGKLRRRHLVKGESLSAIARDTQLSRNTVRKYVAMESGEPRYVRKHQPFPQLGPFCERLAAWLVADSQRPVRERRTAMRLFEALQQAGYGGGYDSVRRFVKRWQQVQRPAVTHAFVPLTFAPGAKYQFDWSHEVVELGGVPQTVKVAHFRLCYSRRALLVAYPRETQEMVFDAHNRAFASWGGVPVAGIYDNPRTLVDAILVGKERQFNRRFLALMNHYLIEPIACTPAAGWEKGQVENQVGTLREWLFTPRLQFAHFDDLNAWLARRCQELEQRPHPDQQDRTIGQLFEEERVHLRPFTAAFDGYVEHPLRVSSTCLVNFDCNRYSVPAAHAGKPASLRAYAQRIQIVADQQIVADHSRSFGRGQSIFDPWHYLPILERKPGALRDGAPFQQWALPDAIRRVQERLMQQAGGDKAFVELLLAGRQQGLEPLEVACALALEQGTPTAAVVLNHLHRLLSPRPLPTLPTPAGLRLTVEPQADCARYDRLRQPEVSHAH